MSFILSVNSQLSATEILALLFFNSSWVLKFIWYLQVLKALNRAKSRGFSDVLYLDSVSKRNIEEVSSCNIFVVKVHYHVLHTYVFYMSASNSPWSRRWILKFEEQSTHISTHVIFRNLHFNCHTRNILLVGHSYSYDLDLEPIKPFELPL